eukprot:COSAG01_NODE_8315_length_2834_cov_1.962706_1_plen_54_part_10
MFFIPNFWGHMRLLQCQQVVEANSRYESQSDLLKSLLTESESRYSYYSTGFWIL